MAVQIPLRRKYLRVSKGRYSGGERPAPRKHRNKIGADKHQALYGPPPVVHLVVNGLTGAGKFVKVG